MMDDMDDEMEDGMDDEMDDTDYGMNDMDCKDYNDYYLEIEHGGDIYLDIIYSTLRQLAIQQIACLMYKAWDLKLTEWETIMEINNVCRKYLELPHEQCHAMIHFLRERRKTFSFGHVIWIMKSNCRMLYKPWLQNVISLSKLCQVTSDDSKYSITDFVVDRHEISTDLHLVKHFRNLRRLVFAHTQVVDWQIQEIISNCPLLSEMHLEECINITDDFANFIWRQQSIQEHLKKLNICYTHISGQWAATLYFLLPRLELLKYDDIASFLRYRCNFQTNENVIRRGLDNTVRLGDIYCDDLRHLKFVTDEELPKVMEIELPNDTKPLLDEEGHRNLFRFDEDLKFVNFEDMFLAMCSVAPHESFGVSPDKAYLKEVIFFQVKNIDLNALLSHFPRLKSIDILHDCSILNPGSKLHLSQSVTDVKFKCMPSSLINQTLKQCPNVERLWFDHVTLSQEAFENLAFNLVKEVQFRCCKGCVQVVFPLNPSIEII